jgi:hypothetical protein
LVAAITGQRFETWHLVSPSLSEERAEALLVHLSQRAPISILFTTAMSMFVYICFARNFTADRVRANCTDNLWRTKRRACIGTTPRCF